MTDRLHGVDAARAAALIGMFATHTLPLRDPEGESVTGLVADGRASALFAVLAGVGIVLSAGRPGGGHLADGAALAVRGLLVGVLGLALVGLRPPVYVILAYYGLLFVVAIPLLRLPAAALAAGAVVLGAVTPALSHLLRTGLSDGPVPQPGLGALADPGDLIVTLGLTGNYPVLTWTTYLLAGMAVGRLDLRSTRVATGLLGGGVALAVLATVVSRVLVDRAPLEESAFLERQYGSPPTDTWWWLVVDLPHSGTPFDLAHTVGSALAVLGLMLLLARWSRALVWVPAAVGSVPLTLYTLHVVALAVYPARGDGRGTVLLAHLAGAVVIGVLLRAAGRRGPLEFVVSGLGRRTRGSVRGAGTHRVS